GSLLLPKPDLCSESPSCFAVKKGTVFICDNTANNCIAMEGFLDRIKMHQFNITIEIFNMSKQDDGQYYWLCGKSHTFPLVVKVHSERSTANADHPPSSTTPAGRTASSNTKEAPQQSTPAGLTALQGVGISLLLLAGLVLVVVLVVVLVWVLWCRKKYPDNEAQPQEMDTFLPSVRIESTAACY
ncbi:hypothetical protein UPYG_G00088110, partial [Umbra pygmaea]